MYSTITQPFYSHYTGPVLGDPLTVKNYRTTLEQSLTVHMPLLMATSDSDLGKDADILLNGVTLSIQQNKNKSYTLI